MQAVDINIFAVQTFQTLNTFSQSLQRLKCTYISSLYPCLICYCCFTPIFTSWSLQ